MSFDLNMFFEDLSQGNVILAYKGTVTGDLINDVLEVVENKLEENQEEIKIRKKIYNVLVESLQNLYHHIDGVPDYLEEKFAIIVVSKINHEYKISVGNYIPNDKIDFLKDKIDKINSLSKEELKDMYKFILNHQRLSAKGGGGLGLVDIARKTGKKLEYNFEKQDNNYCFYILNIFI